MGRRKVALMRKKIIFVIEGAELDRRANVVRFKGESGLRVEGNNVMR